MPRFRKKPIVIEAEQWFPEKEIEGVVVLIPNGDIEGVYKGTAEKQYFIETLEGRMYLSPGDWVITGVNGEKYPCKPDIFEKTYEAIDD